MDFADSVITDMDIEKISAKPFKIKLLLVLSSVLTLLIPSILFSMFTVFLHIKYYVGWNIAVGGVWGWYADRFNLLRIYYEKKQEKIRHVEKIKSLDSGLVKLYAEQTLTDLLTYNRIKETDYIGLEIVIAESKILKSLKYVGINPQKIYSLDATFSDAYLIFFKDENDYNLFRIINNEYNCFFFSGKDLLKMIN